MRKKDGTFGVSGQKGSMTKKAAQARVSVANASINARKKRK
jgi:hypothetical protein